MSEPSAAAREILLEALADDPMIEQIRRGIVQPHHVGWGQAIAAIDAVRCERDEADRRAGAAERRIVHLEEAAAARAAWLSRAKRAAGYDDNVSFDRVWEEALAALIEIRAQPPAWDGMAVMDHGMRTTPGYAANELKGRGLIGLTHNLERLQEWLDAYVAHARAATKREQTGSSGE
jgi:hypothetical protein